jgi:hypothetical protein
VDDHERPIDEPARLYELHRLCFDNAPANRWIGVDDFDGVERIDPIVLARLRTGT